MTKLRLPGRIDASTQRSELEERLPDGMVHTRYSVSFQRARGDGQDTLLEVDDDQIVELELDDGQRLWTRVDDLASDFGISLGRSAVPGTEAEIHVPLELPARSQNRGVGSWVIKGLRILGVDVAGSISEFVTSHVEGNQTPAPGLYRFEAGGLFGLQPVSSLDKSKPILVFIHGTASSIEGSFGALWQSGAEHLADLSSHYQGQVLAFQHRSLSQSPIENALELLQTLIKLPSTVQGSFPLQLHLVSHSRGGLIGELLCRGTRRQGASFDTDDLGLFSDGGHRRDRHALEELGSLLDSMELQVDKFMRVACPARGTTLADARLDRYLSGIVNLLEQIPGVSNPVFDSISSLMLAVVQKRTEPEELPGLEAMMPSSPTVRMLNRPDITVDADLHVIGGDVEGAGLFNRIKVVITDLFYREDHDLVVNTPSMFGGAQRASSVRYWIDSGDTVNHFRYFNNSSTAARLTGGLKQSTPDLFRQLVIEPYRVTKDDYRKRSTDPQPIVFVLPGIMGSHLSVDGERIWLDYLKIARGGLKQLHMDAEVRPEAPLDEAYGELLKYLSATHEVRPFAYDWRISIKHSAEKLRQAMQAAVEEAQRVDQPVRIVAHSMGGLVVRAMLATEEGLALWKRMCEHSGARFIMLGTPNGGSHAIASMLMGRDALARKLALLDIRHDHAELLQTIIRFDGALELLPRQGTLDLHEQASWKQLHEHDVPVSRGVFTDDVAKSRSAGIGWSVPDQAQLHEASRISRRVAGSPIDSLRMIYVAGVAPATPCDISIDPSAPDGYQVQVHASAEGDGRVLWKTGIPAELPAGNVYYMNALHGDLASTEEAFPALSQLLERGVTTKLSQTPILHRDIPGSSFVLPPPVADMYPDQADLLSTVLCSRRQRQRVPTDKCQVRIVHGDLARAHSPVIVGHYEDDTIVSAESYLDRQLSGRLRERHRLGIYPGEISSATILLNRADRVGDGRPGGAVHPGAIVVGLGTVGDLTPGALFRTLVDGLLHYALEVLDASENSDQHSLTDAPHTISAPVTAILISAGTDLSVNDSLRCLLRAVANVNERLKPAPEEEQKTAPGLPRRYVRIDRLDIVEYLEDRALQAMHALVNLSGTREFVSRFEFHPHLVEGTDGRRRASFDDTAGWWQRLRVSVQEGGEFKFETLGERARVECRLQPTQRHVVNQFLAQAAVARPHDPSLGITLFELLMPNEFKDQARDRRNLLLMLDAQAAAYPWELLQDGANGHDRPMSVDAGLIRQLISLNFRAKPVMAQTSSALVIGDPASEQGGRLVLPRLPGAAAEAQQVTDKLNAAGYATVSLIGEAASAMDVLRRLYDRPYRILHIAAHGVFEQPVDDQGRMLLPGEYSTAGSAGSKTKTVSGVVFGNGSYLTPVELEQMRQVPEVVFINCCHLGDVSGDSDPDNVAYPRLAANIATQLISMGVRAVIAAGWAVDDTAANVFANTFYERLLGNSTFGEAVTDARQAIFDQCRGSNTWGAYQCYGDPDFRLKQRAPSRTATSRREPLWPAELEEDLNTLARRCSYASIEERQDIETEFEQLRRLIPESWYDYGTICSAVASVFAALGDLEQASCQLHKARVSERGDASIRSVEQFVNFKARWAIGPAIDVHASDEERERALTELAEAEAIIDALICIHGSRERYSLKGSVHKRKSMLLEKSSQRKELEQMAKAYGNALKDARKKAPCKAFYPLQNSLAARITLSWRGQKNKLAAKSEIEADLQQLKQGMDNANEHPGDFWTACRVPDWQLLDALYRQTLSRTDEEHITQGYLAAQRLGSTGREILSVREHLIFFQRAALQQMNKDSRKTQLCDRFTSMLESLEMTL